MPKALRATRLLLSSSSELIQDGAVVVQDELIIASGPWSAIQPTLSSETEILNLGDVTLMPGLFDCHVHLSMDPSSFATTTATQPQDADLITLMEQNCVRVLDAGVTTGKRDANVHVIH